MKHSIIASSLIIALLPSCGGTSDVTDTNAGGSDAFSTGGAMSFAGNPDSTGPTHGAGMASTGGSVSAATGGFQATGGSNTGGITAVASGGTAGILISNTGGASVASTGGAVATGGSNTGGTFATGGAATIPTMSCTDFGYPVYCPALGTTSAGCWAFGVACSTVTTCSNGLDHACTNASQVYDCEIGKCVCGPNSSYPVACPAIGTLPATCWPVGVVCSTVTSCNGSPSACTSASEFVDCLLGKCI